MSDKKTLLRYNLRSLFTFCVIFALILSLVVVTRFQQEAFEKKLRYELRSLRQDVAQSQLDLQLADVITQLGKLYPRVQGVLIDEDIHRAKDLTSFQIKITCNFLYQEDEHPAVLEKDLKSCLQPLQSFQYQQELIWQIDQTIDLDSDDPISKSDEFADRMKVGRIFVTATFLP